GRGDRARPRRHPSARPARRPPGPGRGPVRPGYARLRLRRGAFRADARPLTLARCVARRHSLSHHRTRDHCRLEGGLGGPRSHSPARRRTLLAAVSRLLRRHLPGAVAVGVRAAARGERMKTLFAITLPLAAIGLVVAPILILRAPNEVEMGLAQKIFYFHVPSAITDFIAIYVCGVASVIYLIKRSPRADAVALAAAELAVLFGACTLVTGSLWGRKIWGVWWQWEVRLTSFALCEMVFIAYLLVRRSGGPGARGLGAALALFGCADVPLIYISVWKWNYLHPPATVVWTLDASMQAAFWTSFATVILVFLTLLAARLRLERQRM